MILKKGSFADFARRVDITGKKVIIYGAGVIGQVIAPYWLERYRLDGAVICYVDADPYKQGRTVPLAAKQVPIRPPAVLEREQRDYAILITVSAFEPVVGMLEQMPIPQGTEVYFLPVMLIESAHGVKTDHVIRTGERQLIPKKIHYCWFSGSPIPEPLQRCMDTWERFCPDYEIIRWDESNYDVNKSDYMRQAYSRKKWGFVSDFARLDILYHHGGIYLDTDVELRRSLDSLLFQPAFCGVEKWGIVNTGGGCGAYPGNPVIKAMLNFRKTASFLQDGGVLNLTSSGYYESLALVEKGFERNGGTQIIGDGEMVVYASEFFHPADYASGEVNITPNTFSIHHFSGTWMGSGAWEERRKTQESYQNFIARLQG